MNLIDILDDGKEISTYFMASALTYESPSTQIEFIITYIDNLVMQGKDLKHEKALLAAILKGLPDGHIKLIKEALK